MKKGYLSQYFHGVAAKRLSEVESDRKVSNQHEFNSTVKMKSIFGEESHKTFPARFLYCGSSEDETFGIDSAVTWYDARKNHPTRSEYRLYFPTNAVMEKAAVGSFALIARKTDNSIIVIIAENGSTAENQLLWLFGFSDDLEKFNTRNIDEEDDIELNFAGKIILEELGIEIEDTADNLLDNILERFNGIFPDTASFSEFARQTSGIDNIDDKPDQVIIGWMEHEERLFRTLERHEVGERLKSGFDNVDDFIKFSLSVHNRRKSRAGFALENHLQHIFRLCNVRFSRGQVTENRSKPDFIFPGITEYRNPDFSESELSMLGVKSTCKDRWRQVLTEANRISKKHLFTLEAGISENQTEEMKSNNLQLVIPADIQGTYRDKQREWLMSLDDFISFVSERQI